MEATRAVLAGVLLVLAALLQTVLFGPYRLPGGPPPLLVLAVVGLAVAGGPGVGAVAGFAGGLVADLMPPAVHPLGLSALVLVLVGWAAGLVGRGPLLGRLLTVAAAAVVAAAGAAGLDALIGDPPTSWPAALGGWLAGAGYATVLALLVLPALVSGWRSLEPMAGRRRLP